MGYFCFYKLCSQRTAEESQQIASIEPSLTPRRYCPLFQQPSYNQLMSEGKPFEKGTKYESTLGGQQTAGNIKSSAIFCLRRKEVV